MASNGSPVVETVSRRRTLPASEVAGERSTPEFWDFLENMKDDDWTNGEYILAISREDPKPSQYGGINQLEVITDGTMQVKPGAYVKINSREALQQAIRQKYGGKAFRLWLKRGRQRVTEGKCMNELPARMPMFDDNGGATAPAYFPPTPGAPMNNGDSTASVANRAIDTLAQNQTPQIMSVAIDAISKAAALIGQKPTETDLDVALRQAMIKRLVDPQTPAAPAEDELQRAFKTALLARLTADPFDAFVRLKDLLQPAPTNHLKDTLDFIATLKTSGLMGVSHGGVWELAASALPHIAGAAKEVMHEWRLGMEAQERGVAVMRGANPAPHVVSPPAQLPASNPAPQAPVSAEPGGPQVITGDPPLEWVEQKIVDIFKRGETVDSTVDYVLDFLAVSYPSLIPLLMDPPKIDPRLKTGEEGLLMLFQNRPVLKQIPVNPRLSEFIKKFIQRVNAEMAHAPAPDPSALLAPEAPPTPPSLQTSMETDKPKARNPRKPA